MLSKTNIQEIANKVAECFSPEKIILFGSYARGDVHDNSDLDLLVVMNSEAPLGKRSAPIIKMLAEHYAEPIDVIVRSSKSLTKWKDTPGSFAHQVFSEGIVLYDEQEQSA